MPKFSVHMWFTPDAKDHDTGTISMRCTHIEEWLRGRGKIHEHNEIEVCSWECPEIDGLTVYLPGTERNADNNIATIPGPRTLYTSYIAALLAAGGEVIESEPASVTEAVEPVKDATEPAEERGEYAVCIDSEDDSSANIRIVVNLTRAELAELVADLIRKG